ncbi:purine-cytosine permease family protein [Streptomyces hygroscopicus]|uniref:purine-cytosine permease family protein n=1 Tax=Streptomyces hygroscopicus TaxID=1912 RepID=UPI00363CF9E2
MNPPIPSADDPASSGAPTTEAVVNQFGKVETAGVDFIPEHARHGKPLDLFFVWASVGTNFLYVLFGGGLVASGLTIGQAFLVAGLASLFWIAPGITAMSGPSSGTPSAIVTRAVYGIRGNRIFGAGVNWLLVIVFEGVALASGTLAGVALLDFLGVKQQNWVTAAVAVVLGIAVFVISFFGHATIIRVSVYLSGASAVFMLGLAAFVLPKASTTVHASAAPLEGSSFWSVFFGGLVLLAAFPLTWGTSADFARYLPSNTPGHKVAAWTAFGGALPQFALTSLGILAGTAVDANNLQLSLEEILPPWFYVALLSLVVMGSMANLVPTFYSSGLLLQGIGLRVRRSRSVAIDAVIGGFFCTYALVSPTFYAGVSDFAGVMLLVLGPAFGVYIADMAIRRNHYNGLQLHDERRGSPFWYWRGFNLAGALALVTGAVAASLCAATKIFVGPVNHLLNGADISSIAGPLAAGATYYLARRAAGVVPPGGPAEGARDRALADGDDLITSSQNRP